MGFPASHQPRLYASFLTSPKIGTIYPNLAFSHKFRQKALKVCHKVSSSRNFQQHSYSVINYLWNGINILAGDDPAPLKFGPKGTDPNMKDARFTFHTRSAVQSALRTFLLEFLVDTRTEAIHWNWIKDDQTMIWSSTSSQRKYSQKWNKLPASVLDATSVNSFKSHSQKLQSTQIGFLWTQAVYEQPHVWSSAIVYMVGVTNQVNDQVKALSVKKS